MTGSSSKYTLPQLPHPDHLRKLAKSRLSALRVTVPSARLAHVQQTMAREYGFQTWGALQAEVMRRHESPRGQWGRIRRAPVAVPVSPGGDLPDVDDCSLVLHVGVATQIGFVLAAVVGVGLVLVATGEFPAIVRGLVLLGTR